MDMPTDFIISLVIISSYQFWVIFFMNIVTQYPCSVAIIFSREPMKPIANNLRSYLLTCLPSIDQPFVSIQLELHSVHLMTSII